MLVLARKVGEKIILNDDIEIIVLDTNQNTVRIGVNAPKNVTVYREELYKEIKNSNTTSKDVTQNSVDMLQELLNGKNQSFKNDSFSKITNKLTQ